MNTIVFDKQKTSIIKGFAIVMMILLHCFGGQDWYDSHLPAMDNVQLISFMGSFKFCVAIYAFMVGYGYNFAKSKNLEYSISHIIKLLIPAWVIIVLFSFPFAHSLNAEIVIKNLFGINSSLHWLSWFIYFYIISILLLPVISRFLQEHTLMKGVILIGVLFVCGILSGKFLGGSNNDYVRCIIAILAYIPLVIEGYIFANIKLFNRLPPPNFEFTPKEKPKDVIRNFTYNNILIS